MTKTLSFETTQESSADRFMSVMKVTKAMYPRASQYGSSVLLHIEASEMTYYPVINMHRKPMSRVAGCRLDFALQEDRASEEFSTCWDDKVLTMQL
jgi:hypothetical protein